MQLMTKTIEHLTVGKTGKILQELRNLIINFKQNGREIGAGMEEFLEYMEGLNLHDRQATEEIKRQQKEYTEKAPKCQKCKAVMYCYPVNTGPQDQIDGDWKSYWMCGNPDCGHMIDSLDDVETENKKYGLGG